MKSVETLLKDSPKIKSITVASDKDLNYIFNSQKGVTDPLKKLKIKNVISDETHNKLRPRALYVSVKVHKPLTNGLP